ncbi:MAG: WG repeat-containing protein [Oceanospirillaceae bacterium]|nr:WG repeat-containing protein [Oceanospirillaceae bacterium]
MFTSQFALAQGLLPVNPGEKWGYINLEGEMVIEPQFSFAGTFHDARAVVRDSGYYYFIDKTGEQIGELKFEFISYFGDDWVDVRIQGQDLKLTWNEIETVSESELLDPKYLPEAQREPPPQYEELGHGLTLVYLPNGSNKLIDYNQTTILEGDLFVGFITDSLLTVCDNQSSGTFHHYFKSGKLVYSISVRSYWHNYTSVRTLQLVPEAGYYPLSREEMDFLGIEMILSEANSPHIIEYPLARLILSECRQPLFALPSEYRVAAFEYEYSTVKVSKLGNERWEYDSNTKVGIIDRSGSIRWLSDKFDDISEWRGHYGLARLSSSVENPEQQLGGGWEKWILIDSVGSQIGHDTVTRFKPCLTCADVSSNSITTDEYLQLDQSLRKYYSFDEFGNRDYQSQRARAYTSILALFPTWNDLNEEHSEIQRIESRDLDFNMYLRKGNTRAKARPSNYSRLVETQELNWHSIDFNSPLGYRRKYYENSENRIWTAEPPVNDVDTVYFMDSGDKIFLSTEGYLHSSWMEIDSEVLFVNYATGWGYITSDGRRIGFDMNNGSYNGSFGNGPPRFERVNRSRIDDGRVVEIRSHDWNNEGPRNVYSYYSLPIFRPSRVQISLDGNNSLWELTIINDIGSDIRSLDLNIQVYHQGEWRKVGVWYAPRLENHHKYPIGYLPTDLGDIQSTMRIVLEYEYDRDGEVVNGVSVSDEVPCTYNAYHVSGANQ